MNKYEVLKIGISFLIGQTCLQKKVTVEKLLKVIQANRLSCQFDGFIGAFS